LDQLIEKVIKTIEKYRMLQEGDKVIIGVSGGPDSVCLADILCKIKGQLNLSLIVAHVHHGIRREEADRDANFVRQQACHWNLPFEQLSISVPEIAKARRLSIEQAGRVERYQYFKKLLGIHQAQKIALGHNADDQVETILMRLIRGCGLRGLGGIPARRGTFIRPLIECTRQEIEGYCERNNISYYLDSSNKEPDYLRNKIRLQLIPLLSKDYNPAITKNVLQLQAIVRDELDFSEGISEQYYLSVVKQEPGSAVFLDNNRLKELPDGAQRSVIRRALKHLNYYLEDIQFNHVEAVRMMCLKGEGEKILDLPGGIKVIKSYQDIIFGLASDLKITNKEKEFKIIEYELAINGETEISALGLKFITKIKDFHCSDLDYKKLIKEADKNKAYLDYDKLNLPLKTRNRRPGDKFQPLNSNFFKKVKSYFIDQKIDRYKRERVMLIVDNSERIAWIAGYQIDNRFKITGNTTRILYIQQSTI